MNKAPIRVWREPIDAGAIVVIAMVEFVFRGGYHMASAWRVVDANVHKYRYQYEPFGEAILREHLIKEHGGHVPYLRRARDDGAPIFRNGRATVFDEQES